MKYTTKNCNTNKRVSVVAGGAEGYRVRAGAIFVRQTTQKRRRFSLSRKTEDSSLGQRAGAGRNDPLC